MFLVRDTRAFVRFFNTPPLFRPKFRGVPLGVGPWCWRLRRANIPS